MTADRLRLGVTLPQFTDDPAQVIGAARRAEALGLDSIWLFDHMWPLTGKKKRPSFECWSTLAYLAAATRRIEIGTLVTRSTMRHPALLAHMASTVARVAPGRLTVALGSGDEASKDENDAFGLPFFAGGRRVGQLESTARLLRAVWHHPPATQRDDFVSIDDLPGLPPLATPPQLWIAGRSRPVLELAGRVGDGWNGWGGTPEELSQEAAAVRSSAAGRAVAITWAGLAILGADDDEARAKLGARDPAQYLCGGPRSVAGQLQERAAAGAAHLILTLPDAREPRSYELLATGVRPVLTERG